MTCILHIYYMYMICETAYTQTPHQDSKFAEGLLAKFSDVFMDEYILVLIWGKYILFIYFFCSFWTSWISILFHLLL